MTYIEFVKEYIERQEYGDPIYTKDIAVSLAGRFGLEGRRAAAAVSVALKRLLDEDRIPGLRRYQKGIYYRTRQSAFGEIRIRKDKMIERKYLSPDQGYETGAGLFYRMGLTTQIPARRYIATNAVRAGIKNDDKLGVSVCPPKTKVTSENKGYLRVLDVLEQMDHIPYDAENPYDLISVYIDHSGLKYEKLLSYADRFYNQKTVLRIGHVARAKEEMHETA